MFRSGGRPFRVSAAVMTFLFLALLAIAAVLGFPVASRGHQSTDGDKVAGKAEEKVAQKKASP